MLTWPQDTGRLTVALATPFRRREGGTTVRTEVAAGVSTFPTASLLVADSALARRVEIAARVVAALLLGYFVFVRAKL